MEQLFHRCALLCAHHEDADERQEDAYRRDDHWRYDSTQLHVAVHGEGRSAQSSSREYGAAIALIEVGPHASHVAHVVAHVVGNGRGVARVVFRNVGLHLAHKVSAHIGSLGVYSASHTGEESLC